MRRFLVALAVLTPVSTLAQVSETTPHPRPPSSETLPIADCSTLALFATGASLETCKLSSLDVSTVANTPVTSVGASSSMPSVPTRATPVTENTGWIEGTVFDATTHDPLIEAKVEIAELAITVRTDLDGRYAIPIKPGVYTLRIVNPPYESRRIPGVIVKANAVTQIEVALAARPEAVETVTVVADPDRSKAQVQLLIRKSANVVSDVMSAEEIAKGSDGNTAEAVRRATGASIVDGKFVYVRGLGERYSYSLLNGARLPTPEPDRQVVPLDLFPTSVVSNLAIIKSASPEVPGDFAGGAVKIETKNFPDKKSFTAQASLTGNSITTFQNTLDHRGSATDILGYDDGMRAMPKAVPKTGRVVVGSKSDGRRLTRDDTARIGREFNNDFGVLARKAPPGFGIALSYGNTYDVGSKPLGVLGSIGYTNGWQRTIEVQRVYRVLSNRTGETLKLDTFSDYTGERGTYAVHWNGLGNLGYQIGKTHRVGYTTFYTLTSERETRRLQGINDEIGQKIVYERQYYLTRSLWFQQAYGKHDFTPFSLDWRATYSEALRQEPDLRELTRIRDQDGQLAWYPKSSSGGHFFSDLVEPAISVGSDITIPFTPWYRLPSTIKIGFLETQRWRRFDVRRFRLLPTENADPTLYILPPSQIFTDSRIGRDLQFEEASRSNDNYRALQEIHALYAMTELILHAQVRVIGGVRFERATQTVTTLDPFAPALAPLTTTLANSDLLPSVNLVFAATQNMNVRLGAARTLARPEFRELAAFSFADFYGGQEVYGNPKLVRTSIQNYDARWEMFPENNAVYAVSVFYKKLSKPIEEIIIPSSTLARSFANADRAVNYGIELEFRQSLRILHNHAKALYTGANATAARSRVFIQSGPGQIQTNLVRPLQGQSDYVLNWLVGWSSNRGMNAQVSYNLFSKRLTAVGALGMPDVYEMPRHTVDATVAIPLSEHWSIKAVAENLFDRAVVLKQAEKLVSRSYRGINVGMNVGYQL